MSLDSILAVSPWLALLACPLGMFWMMRGMHGSMGDGCESGDKRVDGQPDQRDAEIRSLKARVKELEARNRSSGRERAEATPR